MSAGAYGYAMASKLQLPAAAGASPGARDAAYVISERECYEDLTRQEKIPPFLS